MNTTEILTDAMRRMQAGEKLTYTDKEVELIILGWQAELQKAVAAEREACAIMAWSCGMDFYKPVSPADSREIGSKIARLIRARGSR